LRPSRFATIVNFPQADPHAPNRRKTAPERLRAERDRIIVAIPRI